MKLQFKHQKFQADAASAVCKVFNGQPKITPTYIVDKGISSDPQMSLEENEQLTGYYNKRIMLNDSQVLENLQNVQREHQLEPSDHLDGKYNLTVEMETGVGKTYTYIKTIFELNKLYGWSKFIVVVPSVAIREGVYKSFQMTQEHFSLEYNKKVRFFIYNSKDLTKIEQFASDSGINVMIINSQAFNARGKDARRIYMELDEFQSRKPIDVIAATNPIVIIDEPQSVEGKATKEKLKEFKPLMTLRYSATHKKGSIYNMVYRLDALEAYNKRLVKRIAVKGISVSGTTGTDSYLYLERINLSGDKPPTATLGFEKKGKNKVRRITRKIYEEDNLYDLSDGLEQYKGFTVARINGFNNSVEFTNGVILYAGEVVGDVNEDHLRRIQIRETIQSHLEKERELFYKGIKVLTLFFIDEVAKYKRYDEDGQEINGIYGEIFEEEYRSILNEWQIALGEDDYLKYINNIDASTTHKGYFSIDKKSRQFKDSKINNRKENTSDDEDAYDLIMKDKERLLDLKENVRFIFSHSALREGWDNPNVFQICTLKQSGSDVRKRQEVGRGLRLCVNNMGQRMDATTLGEDVHKVNTLTVIANESYEDFTKSLQSEIASVVADRPKEVTHELFENKVIKDENGLNEQVVDRKLAIKITNGLIRNGYINDENELTETYYDDVKNNQLKVPEELAAYTHEVVSILDSIYDPSVMKPENARDNNVEAKVDHSKLRMKEFKELWNKINHKSAYVVNFDTDELIRKSINELDRKLRVSKIYFKVAEGEMETIKSKESLTAGEDFKKKFSKEEEVEAAASTNVKYDLIGEIVEHTGLTRQSISQILRGINQETFEQFKMNPEEFIIKASNLINEQKATVIIEHISYNKLEESYSTDIFTEPTLKGKLDVNAIKTDKHLYDYLIFDSSNERKFAEELDTKENIALYIKLPNDFYINTPVGKYNPDWAIAFEEGTVKHVYFVAETKGSMSSLSIRKVEELKKKCAEEHFKKISDDSVKYDIVSNYEELLNFVNFN
ncbi:restriction endonuclease subunit R [Allobacillus sp. SKP2-8]|uniref:type III restriction-modification system endonuclease n=1 Tax=unclassified Allobacillus TaxID=2628859 RepID=UPI00118280E1|nr:DEAD/DEAH box helicase family protein [Allobacillus sp. SKP2-8]TSJ65134.1 restriction endonuclease subunit R [Allobacillus sp. SKP2-8]